MLRHDVWIVQFLTVFFPRFSYHGFLSHSFLTTVFFSQFSSYDFFPRFSFHSFLPTVFPPQGLSISVLQYSSQCFSSQFFPQSFLPAVFFSRLCFRGFLSTVFFPQFVLTVFFQWSGGGENPTVFFPRGLSICALKYSS